MSTKRGEKHARYLLYIIYIVYTTWKTFKALSSRLLAATVSLLKKNHLQCVTSKLTLYKYHVIMTCSSLMFF